MNQYMQSMESINQTGYHVRLIICGLHVKQYETKFIGNDSILKLTCKYSQVNKTLSLWKAQSNALSRVSPSRWGVTKPDVVVLIRHTMAEWCVLSKPNQVGTAGKQ